MDHKNRINRGDKTWSFYVKDFVVESYSNKESRPIFKFIICTCIYLLIEVLYSYLADSLSLLTDAVHMLCDLTAMIIGLAVTYIQQRQKKIPEHKRSFYLQNIESLAGLGNALFLQIMAISMFYRSINRMQTLRNASIFDQHIINENPLVKYNNEMIIVSIGGLLLNIVGLFLFQ